MFLCINHDTENELSKYGSQKPHVDVFLCINHYTERELSKYCSQKPHVDVFLCINPDTEKEQSLWLEKKTHGRILVAITLPLTLLREKKNRFVQISKHLPTSINVTKTVAFAFRKSETLKEKEKMIVISILSISQIVCKISLPFRKKIKLLYELDLYKDFKSMVKKKNGV